MPDVTRALCPLLELRSQAARLPLLTAQWCALHALLAWTRALEPRQLDAILRSPRWTISPNQARKIGVRLRKLLDENPGTCAISTRARSHPIRQLCRDRGIRERQFFLSRNTLEAFVKLCLESRGFDARRLP